MIHPLPHSVVCDTDVFSFLFNRDPLRGPGYARYLEGPNVFLPFSVVGELCLERRMQDGGRPVGVNWSGLSGGIRSSIQIMWSVRSGRRFESPPSKSGGELNVKTPGLQQQRCIWTYRWSPITLATTA